MGASAIASDSGPDAGDDVTRKVADARRQERARLARELHDGLGQTLTSAALLAGSLETGAGMAELRRLIEVALAETTTIMWRLRPTDVEELGLEAALGALAETFRRCHGVRVDVHLSGLEGLSPPVEAAVYRVAQEAMVNAVKHAAPSVLSILAHRRVTAVTLVVEDDGTGFEPSDGRAHAGAGVPGMGERAAALGGRLDVESAPGRGTTVRLVVSYDPEGRR